ncbi:MAG: polyphosphate polymerase domain-containing protein [Ignavibacteria bacterium]|jgi:SPX domain protein involved in polyphosphate accumulation|nr:polyphosphate polymerase domain-containing protein [Ignavibacteria bacterium]MCU7502942.1 polyphosphate polymerase domain-containing protein [Ignavibacteria bacterium]MCU7517075.1 polyphosphate polymerase domain-containing protein [Ignavibacteria bacterium]
MTDNGNVIEIERYAKKETAEFQFRRLEKKFLINTAAAEIMKGQVGFYLPNDEKAYKYPGIRSVYFDNRELKCFNEHMNKVNPRFKVRFRQYKKDENIQGAGFLEIKKKNNEVTVKDRFKADFCLIDKITDETLPDFIVSENKGLNIDKLSCIYYEITGKMGLYKLEPVTAVNYRREAFENSERTLRITFDSDLEFEAMPNKILGFSALKSSMPQDFIIMEIKYADSMPEWLKSLLKFNGLRSEHFSKYCESIRKLKLSAESSQMNAVPGFNLFKIN